MACAGEPEPAPAPDPAATQPAAVPAAEHPGEIVFVDLDAKTETRRPAADVPETIAWATVDGRRVAVVRVESSAAGGAREIRRYGADGAPIDTTVGR